MIGMVLSMGLPSAPWQPAQISIFSAIAFERPGASLGALRLWANAVIGPKPKAMPRMIEPGIVQLGMPPIQWFNEAQRQSGAATGPASLPLATNITPNRSIERKGDDVVAAFEVDLGVAPGADHDVLLGA